MAVIGTVNANDLVRMDIGSLVAFNRSLDASPTNFTWLSDDDATDPPLADIDINGTGFSYKNTGSGTELAGGTITSIAIDYFNNNGSDNAGICRLPKPQRSSRPGSTRTIP